MKWWGKGKERAAAAEPPRAPAKVGEPLTHEGLSETLHRRLSATQQALDQCSRTRGTEFAAARRQLREVRDEAMTTIEALVSGEPQDSRLRRMARLVTDEIWEMAGRWLSLKAVVAYRVPMTTEELSSLQRDLRMAAELAVADCRDARGRELAAVRERLRHILDEANAAARAAPGMSQSQALTWQRAAAEISEFAAPALGR